MATILKHKKAWRVQIRRKNITRSAIFRTKAEAELWALKIESDIALGVYDTAPKDITFDDLIDKYIHEVSINKKTYRAESLRLLKIAKINNIGKIKLSDLTEEHFIKWRDTRLTQIKSSSVAREFATLSNLCKIATQWKLLKENPIENIKRPKPLPSRTRRFEESEIKSLVFAAEYDSEKLLYSQAEKTAAAMLFAIETGMRAGEICNAKWEHLNRKIRVLHLPATKNGYARDVPLSTKAYQIIKQLEQNSGESDFIFRLTAKQLDYSFRKLKEKAGLKESNLHFHDTRREALTRLAKKSRCNDFG